MQVMNSAILVILTTVLGVAALPAQAAPIQPSAAVLSATAELRLPTPGPLSGTPRLNTGIEARRPTKRTGEVLMIVGGAGILVGLLADEAIVTIAGAAVGGYGLYVYLTATNRRR
jgi:hypothetical protein